jgi:ketosteroid isomerase-like protein
MSGGLSNADIVRRFYEGWNRGDINFAELVAEDIVNHQPEAEPARGRSRFADAIRPCHGRRPGLAVDDLRRPG